MDRPFELRGLDHVVLKVRDQPTSIRFYTELLGLAIDHVNARISLVQLRCGQHLIDLLPLPEGETADPQSRMDHLCLSIRADDMEKVEAYLRERGVRLEGGIVTRRGAFGEGPSLYIRDPDGYRVELKPVETSES